MGRKIFIQKNGLLDVLRKSLFVVSCGGQRAFLGRASTPKRSYGPGMNHYLRV
jgi:hypothetical protein